MDWFKGFRLDLIIGIVACGVLLHNILLMRQNWRLRTQILSPEQPVQEGAILVPFGGLNLRGEYATVDFSRPVVLFTFSTGCSTSHEVLNHLRRFSPELKAQGWEIVGISRDPLEVTREYCRQSCSEITDVVLADLPCRAQAQLKLDIVPQIIAVGSGGQVEKVWVGHLDERAWHEVMSYFHAEGTKGIPRKEALAGEGDAIPPKVVGRT
jgi:peroxiredoxin